MAVILIYPNIYLVWNLDIYTSNKFHFRGYNFFIFKRPRQRKQNSGVLLFFVLLGVGRDNSYTGTLTSLFGSMSLRCGMRWDWIPTMPASRRCPTHQSILSYISLNMFTHSTISIEIFTSCIGIFCVFY